MAPSVSRSKKSGFQTVSHIDVGDAAFDCIARTTRGFIAMRGAPPAAPSKTTASSNVVLPALFAPAIRLIRLNPSIRRSLKPRNPRMRNHFNITASSAEAIRIREILSKVELPRFRGHLILLGGGGIRNSCVAADRLSPRRAEAAGRGADAAHRPRPAVKSKIRTGLRYVSSDTRTLRPRAASACRSDGDRSRGCPSEAGSTPPAKSLASLVRIARRREVAPVPRTGQCVPPS